MFARLSKIIFAALAPALLATLLLYPAHAGQSESARNFLKHSMSRYQSLQSCQATCLWNMVPSGFPAQNTLPKDQDTRTILYVQPNRFKVVSTHYGSFVQTSVSDGSQLVEYSSMPNIQAMRYPAPSSLAKADSMQMQHPMFCGSLLYKFFGGPGNLANLVDSGKGAVSYGKDIAVNGEACKTILFTATGTYGHAKIAISARDFLVRRISYDSAPLMIVLKQQYHGKFPSGMETTETYQEIKTDQPIPGSAFSTTIPAGTKAAVMPGQPDDTPPVPLGSLAPDFSVTPIRGGAPVRLSSLRGHVVLLDFWATWCPPCRKGLPETQKLSAQFGSKGLAVLAISDESQKTIASFVNKNHYTFPAYRDTESATNKQYKINAIPTVAVMDREGHLVAYFVGLQQPETISAALKKAGLSL